MERDLTKGSIFRNVVYFSLPYLLSYFLQTLYGMADLYIVGQFDGVEATTAVSIGSQIMHMLTVMIVGLAMGTTVTIGKAIGAGDKKKCADAIGNTVVLFLTVAVIATILLLFCVDPIIRIMSTPQAAVAGTTKYLIICFIGIPFITAYNIISAIFRGLGDSKSPMYFIAIACVCNIALDYLFIGLLHMGAAGAALGTTLSQTISVLISLCMIRIKKTGISISRKNLRPRKETMAEILLIGTPVALQDGLIQVAFLFITVIANKRGINDAAAVGIVEKLISLVFLVPSSMLSTVSAISSQNIGAGLYDRAKKTLQYCTLIAMGYGVLMIILIEPFASPVVGLFTKNLVVRAMGAQYLRGYIIDCMFAGMHFCFSGYFCAYGMSGISFLHNVLSMGCIRIPGAYLMSKWFPKTLFPMGLAAPAGSVLSVLICVIAFVWLQKHQKRMQSQG
ncbi:MAG: MATE family efflux transporter [Lachnospiraceae bacterium]|nr:MATE family efflux transporter [Lachnospiraceae bacterium]